MNAEQFNAGGGGASSVYGSIVAWIVFNGTGTPSITASSSNVNSITDNGVGDYTINFSALVNANYGVVITQANGGSVINTAHVKSASSGGAPITKTTTAVRIETDQYNAAIDSAGIYVLIFNA